MHFELERDHPLPAFALRDVRKKPIPAPLQCHGLENRRAENKAVTGRTFMKFRGPKALTDSVGRNERSPANTDACRWTDCLGGFVKLPSHSALCGIAFSTYSATHLSDQGQIICIYARRDDVAPNK